MSQSSWNAAVTLSVLAVCLFAAATPATAQSSPPDAGSIPVATPQSVVQSIDPPAVHLGQPFVRKVVITHAKNERWEVRIPSELGEFELLGHQRRRDDAGDTASTEFTFKMSAFELGKRTIPSLHFDVTTPQGMQVFDSDPAEVEITATISEEDAKKGADLYDIRPPEELPIPSYTLLWAILVGLVVAALAYLLYRWWKRPRPLSAVPAGPPIPLERRTRDLLDALRAENLPAQGRTKEHYSRLADIVRGYVGTRFGIEALECTSYELLAALKNAATPGLPREDFANFLSEADLVKFAKAQMTPEDSARALDFAYRLVDLTTHAAPAAPAASTDDSQPPLR